MTSPSTPSYPYESETTLARHDSCPNQARRHRHASRPSPMMYHRHRARRGL
jgi:hypothetical protein